MEMGMDWNALGLEIHEAARKVFDDLKKAHPEEEVYAYALYTDSGAMTVLGSANSVRGFEKAISQQPDTSPATLAYYKWATSEWAYEGWKSSYFNEISEQLRTSKDRADFSSFKRNILASMKGALKKLDEEGFFGTGAEREKVVLFISVTDDDSAESVENESAILLNPKSIAEKFALRYER
jgi:Domain of unknown function (DUF4303)